MKVPKLLGVKVALHSPDLISMNSSAYMSDIFIKIYILINIYKNIFDKNIFIKTFPLKIQIHKEDEAFQNKRFSSTRMQQKSNYNSFRL